MITSKCQAKDPNKCPYHGAVLAVDRVQAKIMPYVANSQPIPPQLFQEFLEAKDAVDRKIAEGWDEQAFAALWSQDKNEDTQDSSSATTSAAPDQTPAVQAQSRIPSSSAPEATRQALPQVVSVVNKERTVFTRGDMYDLTRMPKYVRLQFHAPLTKKSKAQFASMIQYALKVSFKDSTAKFDIPEDDTKFSFVVSLDSLKSKKDFGEKFQNFGKLLKVIVREGTPKRPTHNDTRRYERVDAPHSDRFKIYFASYND